MKRLTTKIVHKKKAVSLSKNKKDLKLKKQQRVKATKIIKPSEEKIEKVTLLNANQVRTSLKNLIGWQANDNHKMIYREFILQDFMAAINLIDRIAEIAEDEKHHPDVHLTQYRNLRVGITTHEVGGLSENDFNVAMKINDLPVELKH